MRYIIDTKDSEGIIGVQIAKWAKEQKIDLIEKADPILEIKANLEKTARALEALKQAGMNSEVMRVWLVKKTGMSMSKVTALLNSQNDFFKAIGVKTK
jgi:2-polyprenyl-6-methoxyphenol hydroxylase-like FAD-dependent oxidoreductase